MDETSTGRGWAGLQDGAVPTQGAERPAEGGGSMRKETGAVFWRALNARQESLDFLVEAVISWWRNDRIRSCTCGMRTDVARCLRKLPHFPGALTRLV